MLAKAGGSVGGAFSENYGALQTKLTNMNHLLGNTLTQIENIQRQETVTNDTLK
jgi:hypothetical protein